MWVWSAIAPKNVLTVMRVYSFHLLMGDEDGSDEDDDAVWDPMELESKADGLHSYTRAHSLT